MDATLTPGKVKTLSLDGTLKNFDDTLNFSAVSEEIKKFLAPERVMTEIVIDGKSISLLEEEEMATALLSTLGTIEVKSREVNELYLESLQLAPQICEALTMDAIDIKEFFLNNDLVQAQDRVGEMTSLLEWLLQLISGFQALGTEDLNTMTFSQGSVMETVDRMQTLLSRLHETLAGQDWERFQETLTGDFIREVNVWKSLFVEVAKTWTPRNSKRES